MNQETLDMMKDRCNKLKNLASSLSTVLSVMKVEIEVLRSYIAGEEPVPDENPQPDREIDPLKAPEIEGADKHGDGGQAYTPRIELDE